ncbi:MAG: aminotransferase class I/II-fold pyridoxal phosphate-dependent enzyme [Syntrophobacteraceae bacterium]|nr:aminotransferase class I/II-fold pyridoxal phosphate-dependent enzyme [Syntrophobacteraceae bacterium]
MKTDPKKSERFRKSTTAIHAGGLERSIYGEMSVPIFQSSTFAFPSAEDGAARFSGEKPGYIYSRLDNPTVNALEENVATLEGGFGAVATATGMAAVSSVYLSFLGRGDHVVAASCIYGASRVILESELSRYGVEATFVDSSDLVNIEKAMRQETRMVFVETPMNPSIRLTDLAGAAAIAKKYGSDLVVDNTFASPYLQRPIEFGADIVIHSLTKFINGHADVIGGMVVARDQEHYDRVKKVAALFGNTMDPHQAWLILRGSRTLALRVERGQENAMKLARFLESHPKVSWVSYPGLLSHPQHELAKRQMDGFGCMISFGVEKGLEGGLTLMNNVRLIALAVSLGGVESLIEHPASMTHACIAAEKRREAGILDELVRLSVGCEDFEDLRDDLDQALNRIGEYKIKITPLEAEMEAFEEPGC